MKMGGVACLVDRDPRICSSFENSLSLSLNCRHFFDVS